MEKGAVNIVRHEKHRAERAMTPDTLARIAAQAVGALRVRAAAGDAVFRQGDPCRGFLAVDQGSIRVVRTSAAGREIVLYRVQPGQVCLQTFACLAHHRHYDAEGIVETPLTGTLIPPAEFDRLIATDARFRAAVLFSVADRFADFEEAITTLAFTGLEQRVATALLRLADGEGNVPATHEALAAEIGSAREAVSRQLGAFARAGLVALARGRVHLVRPDELKRLASGPV